MTDQSFVAASMPRQARIMRIALLAGALAGSAVLAGCSSSAPRPDKMAQAARDALNHGDPARAVSLAEAAVMADGRNPAARLTLANAYLRSGRFESAHTAFSDAIGLGDDSSRAALGLVLSELALGKNTAALDTLNTYSDAIPAADLGLALVMAGQNERGIGVLTTAIRQGQNTPKMRQNLAYAYALSGLWSDARIMAGQDLPADQIDARLQKWAAMARPEDSRGRVASLLAVPLRGDDGQPDALALAHFPAAPGAAPVQQAAAPAQSVQTAQIGPAAELPAVPGTSGAIARIDLPPAQPATGLPAQAAAQRNVRPVAPPLRVATPPHRLAKAAPATRTGGTHLVQLGAFSSEGAAHRAWTHYVRHDPRLAAYASQITQAVVNGRTFWRVQATGFANQTAARSLCEPLRAHGGVCMVMAAAGANRAAPVRTAAIKPANIRFARR